MAQFFADDFALGGLISRNGWSVILSPYTCDTVVADPAFGAHVDRAESGCKVMSGLLGFIS